MNQGLSPNDAIVKAASEAELPPGHVALLVNAYNTGRTTRQREVGQTPFEKAADFELADTSTVLERLYPTEVKTAAQVQRETVVSFEYAVPPTGMIERHREKLARQERAKIEFPPLPAPTYQPEYDIGAQAKRAHDRARANVVTIEEARRLVTASYQKAAAQLDELREYFFTSGHMSYGDAAREIELRCGDRGKSVMQKLAEMEPKLTKQAATNAIFMGKNRPAEMVESLLNMLEEHAELKIAYEKIATDLTAANEAMLRPFAPRPSRYILEEESSEKTGNAFTWGMTGAAMKDVMGGLAKSIAPPEDKLLNKSIAQLSDPHHEADLRNIRTQAMLQDLMNNDPVISGYNADEVMGGFNEISELSPRSTDQRMIMQSLLRKRLQQGTLDPFEIDQVLGMEGKLKKRDQGVMDDRVSGSII